MFGMSMLEEREIAGWNTDVLKMFLSVPNHNFPFLKLRVLNPLAVHLQEEFGSFFGSVAWETGNPAGLFPKDLVQNLKSF